MTNDYNNKKKLGNFTVKSQWYKSLNLLFDDSNTALNVRLINELNKSEYLCNDSTMIAISNYIEAKFDIIHIFKLIIYYANFN